MNFTLEILILGLLRGLAYAVLGAGLVLVYRSTKVINFAHGELGAFGAAVLGKLVIDLHWNFFAALALVLAIGGVCGALLELLIVRRLAKSSRLVLLVGTIGAAQLFLVFQLMIPNDGDTGFGVRFPSPLPWNLTVGSLILDSSHFMVAIFVPIVLLGLTWLLTRTTMGLRLRAAADNRDATELAGISTNQVSTFVWALAGVLSTLTIVLINPLQGVFVGVPTLALGPGLLMRAVAAAQFGRLQSIPATLVGGLVVGVLESFMLVNSGGGGTDAAIFVLLVVLVLVRARGTALDVETWSLAPKAAAVPEYLRTIGWFRNLSGIIGSAGLGVAVLLPIIFTSSSQTFLFTRVLLFGMIGLSVTVLTGWAGQLSLGQVAFVGLGSMTTAALLSRGMPFLTAVGYSAVAGALAAVLIGFPALRVSGLYLALTTLGFAVFARGWLLQHDVFLDGDTVATVSRPEVFGVDLAPGRSYYYLCLVVLTVSVLMVSRLRRTGAARAIIATRENELAAASKGIVPASQKLQAFAFSGALAATAGGLLAGLRVSFGAADFDPSASLEVVAMTVIGGLGTVAGALLGAVYVIGIPALFDDNPEVALFSSGVGLLFLLLYLPGGLMQLVYFARDALVRRLDASFAGERSSSLDTPRAVAARHSNPRQFEGSDTTPLRVEGLFVHFGGLQAVAGMDLVVDQGEVIGLIGSNGAGKSTLMNAVSGYVPPSAGRIVLYGDEVTGAPPHRRAAYGLGRVFQDARIFPELTVREALMVAMEAVEPSHLVPSALALPSSTIAERTKRSEADEYLSYLGLGRYADMSISSLSTGTRRIVELAGLLAQGARLLLLDEPTAGVAQREAEAFGPLIKSIQLELGASVLIIEHDLPLILSMSDRVYCMSAGAGIAAGPPGTIRHDPAVVAAYLGTDERAINRSDSGSESAASSANGAVTEASRTPGRARPRRQLVAGPGRRDGGS